MHGLLFALVCSCLPVRCPFLHPLPQRMEGHVESRQKEAENALERATKPMRIGATCANKKSSSGSQLFFGDVRQLSNMHQQGGQLQPCNLARINGGIR